MTRTRHPAFGEQLRAARKARGLSQARLAVLLGTSQKRVWMWEHGSVHERSMRVETISVIAIVLRQTFSLTMGRATVVVTPDGIYEVRATPAS